MENGNEQEKNSSMSMADRFITAMFLPKEYGKLMKDSIGKLILYLTLLVLLVSVIRYGIPPLGSIAGMGGLKNVIMNVLPDFSLEDGEFYMSEKVDQSDAVSGVYVIIDTAVDAFSKEDIPEGALEAILVGRTNALFYNQVTAIGGQTQLIEFKDYKDAKINNKTVANVRGWFYVFFAGMFVFLYVFEYGKYLFVALFFATTLFVLLKMLMVECDFGKLYKTALYAQSIGIVVNAVTCCIGSPVLMSAGYVFYMLLTVLIMNRATNEINGRAYL